MSLAEALSRTLLLMRSDLVADIGDDVLIAALTSVRVVLHAGDDALATHSGQTALVTAALTIARSGHEVWVDAAETARIGPQPPLDHPELLAGLVDTGADLLPGRSIRLGRPAHADLAIVFGTRPAIVAAGRTLWFDATDWSARLGSGERSWSGGNWPLGAIAAGVMAASEAFRMAMRSVACHARLRAYFDDVYSPSGDLVVTLAPEHTRQSTWLPAFDIISGGAIANAVLFALARLPGVVGSGRVFDDDRSALSNLNRNALLRRRALDAYKVTDLASIMEDIALAPEPVRYAAGTALLPTVLVGVDDIPSRWAAQAMQPDWLGVGATEGFSVLTSSHVADQPCAGCLHPVAATPNGPIPTAAFVSLLSGLMLVVRWQAALGEAGGDAPRTDQQYFVNALRPEGWSLGAMPLMPHADCPVGCAASRLQRAA
jgi:hypothetical protein